MTPFLQHTQDGKERLKFCV